MTAYAMAVLPLGFLPFANALVVLPWWSALLTVGLVRAHRTTVSRAILASTVSGLLCAVPLLAVLQVSSR